MIESLLTFFTALFISLMCFPPFIKFMERKQYLDSGGGRKIHKGYVAHMGGLIIFLSFLFSSIVWFSVSNHNISWDLLRIMIVLFFIVLIGVRDDLNSLTPTTKLLCEIFLGLLMCYFGLRLESLYGLFGIYEIPVWISYPLTIFFYIVVMNAYNLIDGIDGQAGVQGISYFFFLAIVYVLHGNSWLAIVSSSMIGAIAGFLYFNWQPAKVFMGDTGSLFIGFAIGIIAIATMNFWGAKLHIDFYARPVLHVDWLLQIPTIKSPLALPICFFFLPLADMLRVFVYRLRKRKNPFSPDKKHIHHLLLSMGYNYKQCTCITASITFVVSLTGILLAFLITDLYFLSYLVLLYLLYVLSLKLFIRHKMNKKLAKKSIW